MFLNSARTEGRSQLQPERGPHARGWELVAGMFCFFVCVFFLRRGGSLVFWKCDEKR